MKNDIYAHIDKDGRYRVNLDFDRDTWKPGYESLWVRQSRPYAGDTYGLHLPLLAGTEVSIAFEEGNPDRPYIAGVKHDSAHTDHVTIQNYKRNVLRTPANNKIRLDDERGKEHIKVSTEYGGKSQLNLGHLVDAGKQQRGEGFELRTDLWGHLPLLAGTEVSIAFEEGNPDRPYIAGVKHDSAHTDHVTIQNYKRNVLRTPANNKIRLDDERGKEHIKVSTEYGGKSQLNLGHLVDAGKQQRGEGFELRTDLWGLRKATRTDLILQA